MIGENLEVCKFSVSGEGLDNCKVVLSGDVLMSFRVHVDAKSLKEGLLTKPMKLEAVEGLGSIFTLEPSRYAKEVEHYKNLGEKLMVIQTKFLNDIHGIFSI